MQKVDNDGKNHWMTGRGKCWMTGSGASAYLRFEWPD